MESGQQREEIFHHQGANVEDLHNVLHRRIECTYNNERNKTKTYDNMCIKYKPSQAEGFSFAPMPPIQILLNVLILLG